MITEPTIHKGAGILFVAPQGKALFLKRGDGGDMPGFWCFPGGTLEAGETTLETAVREAGEELGKFPKGDLKEHCRTVLPVTTINPNVTGTPLPVADKVDFTTFIQMVDKEFTPQLNGEHTGWAWASLDQPPDPLHPGCRIAIDRITMNELGVARAMAAGQMTSPQKYRNVWLFDMRITGTGVAHRNAKKNDEGKVLVEAEYTFRRPENYLTEEFIARCNGLSVIMKHPKKALLNSEEYGNRVVGAMMLPYIKGDEVWGIAKVYDDDAVDILRSSQMSTSPAVLLGADERRLKTEDGTNLLIEDTPILLDHLAICETGVWDKGGDPSGIRTDSQGDTEMFTTEQTAALNKQISDTVAAAVPSIVKTLMESTALARADDNGSAKLEKILTALDSAMVRMDAFEKKMDEAEKKDAKKDAKKDDDDMIAADEDKKDDEDEDKDKKKDKKSDSEDEKEAKKKADSEEKAKCDAEEKEKAEKEKADSSLRAENADMKARLVAMEKNFPKLLDNTNRAAFGDVQVRADAVYSAFAERASGPMQSEDIFAYRKRLIAGLKEHSPSWKDVDVYAIADSAHFEVVEKMVLAEAAITARRPLNLKVGELRAIPRVDQQTGVRVIEFVGDRSFIHNMKRQSRNVKRIGVQIAAT